MCVPFFLLPLLKKIYHIAAATGRLNTLPALRNAFKNTRDALKIPDKMTFPYITKSS